MDTFSLLYMSSLSEVLYPRSPRAALIWRDGTSPKVQASLAYLMDFLGFVLNEIRDRSLLKIIISFNNQVTFWSNLYIIGHLKSRHFSSNVIALSERPSDMYLFASSKKIFLPGRCLDILGCLFLILGQLNPGREIVKLSSKPHKVQTVTVVHSRQKYKVLREVTGRG